MPPTRRMWFYANYAQFNYVTAPRVGLQIVESKTGKVVAAVAADKGFTRCVVLRTQLVAIHDAVWMMDD